MAKTETIQTAIRHLAIMVATPVVMVLKEADAGPTSGASTVNVGEAHRQ